MENKSTLEQEARRELGVYVHIPFCQSKCYYCDFLSCVAGEQTHKDYLESLIKEIKSYAELSDKFNVKTIYIGGGTPSILDAENILRIMETIKEAFGITRFQGQVEEITLEANPGTLTREKLQIYKKAGINRLSIGLQSADDKELSLLGRIHTFEQFKQSFILARQAGFDNINVDLMSGLPKQTLENFEKSLKEVILLQPEHISVYSLIIERETPFYKIYGHGGERQCEMPSEDHDRDMYEKTKEVLVRNGYYRYEISNYCRPGFESKHNSAYWQRREYLAAGLGASSLIKNRRFHNTEDFSFYLENSDQFEKVKLDFEVLTKNRQMEEFMFLGLRLCNGIIKSSFREQFHASIEITYGNVLKTLEDEGLIINDVETIRLTDRGIDISNYVLSQFLLEDL